MIRTWHAEPEWYEKKLGDLTDEQAVAIIIDWLDEGRIGMDGGYPSDYVIENGKIYWATLDSGKEYRAPELVVLPIKAFLAEYLWVFEELSG